MKKAKIKGIEVVDSLAATYLRKKQGGTIMEVLVETRAEFGERVKIEELGAVSSVVNSRWVDNVKVVHFTANDWQYLRGTQWVEPHLVDKARQLTL